MTKKSLNRQMRDKQKVDEAANFDNNQCWDDLNAIYNDSARMLHQHSSITGFLRNTELMKHVTDISLLSRLGKQLAADLSYTNEELAALHALHKDKTGSAEEMEILLQCLEIYQRYVVFIDKHKLVLEPTFLRMVELIQEAERLMNIANGINPDEPTASDAVIAEQQQDTSIITDVIFNEQSN